jgi:hypothetical protein
MSLVHCFIVYISRFLYFYNNGILFFLLVQADKETEA